MKTDFNFICPDFNFKCLKLGDILKSASGDLVIVMRYCHFMASENARLLDRSNAEYMPFLLHEMQDWKSNLVTYRRRWVLLFYLIEKYDVRCLERYKGGGY